jgi:hypothetical protein
MVPNGGSTAPISNRQAGQGGFKATFDQVGLGLARRLQARFDQVGLRLARLLQARLA